MDEAELKASLNRSIGAEKAPGSLHRRVVVALDRAESGDFDDLPAPTSPHWTIFRNPVVALALAAMLVIAIGLAAMQQLGSQSKPIAMTLPHQYAQAMADAAEFGVKQFATESAPQIAASDLSNIGQKLRNELNCPVLAPDLGDGWIARGAQVTSVYNIPTAQVIYTRGTQTISVFSVSVKRLYSPPEGATYEMLVNGHALAGFVKHRTLHCVVADSSTSPAEAKMLADRLQQL